MVGNGAVTEQPAHGDQVLVRSPARLRGERGYREIAAACHPLGEVDVMSGEIHHYADIANPLGEWPLAACRDLEHRSQLALFEPRPKRADSRVVSLDMSNGADQASLLECLGQQPPTVRVRSQRLLDQSMHSGICEPEPDVGMCHGRRGHDTHVKTEYQELIQVSRD